jgi:hypothetical protein
MVDHDPLKFSEATLEKFGRATAEKLGEYLQQECQSE